MLSKISAWLVLMYNPYIVDTEEANVWSGPSCVSPYSFCFIKGLFDHKHCVFQNIGSLQKKGTKVSGDGRKTESMNCR